MSRDELLMQAGWAEDNQNTPFGQRSPFWCLARGAPMSAHPGEEGVDQEDQARIAMRADAWGREYAADDHDDVGAAVAADVDGVANDGGNEDGDRTVMPMILLTLVMLMVMLVQREIVMLVVMMESMLC
eukprot:2307695-Pyramimonas_sp.AAC.1